MRVRSLFLSGCALILAGSTFAQEVPRFTYNIGGGFTTPSGRASRRVDTGWNIDMGAGINFNQWLGAMVQANIQDNNVNSRVLNNLGFPDGSVKMWAFTLDPVIHRRSRWRKRVMELWYQDRLLRNAAAIHYTSAEEMRLAEPYVFGAPGVVVPLGLDLTDYSALPEPGTFRRSHPEIGERPILLFLSRLNFKKGLDVLIQATARVIAAGIDAHLVLAGPDGGMEASARRWIAEAGLEGRSTFTGMLRGKDKLAAFVDAALFVLPSLSENFGIAVVEAMACGTPVLVSDRVNIWREIVADGAGIAEPPAPDAFAAAMLSLLNDEPRRRAMGQAARASVARRYQWNTIAGELERLYAQVLEKHRSPARVLAATARP